MVRLFIHTVGDILGWNKSNGKEVKKYFTPHKLVEKYGLPERSSLFMNDSGYMDDET